MTCHIVAQRNGGYAARLYDPWWEGVRIEETWDTAYDAVWILWTLRPLRPLRKEG